MNPLPSAFLPLATTVNPSYGLNSDTSAGLTGPSGATAQTGGFAQAGSSPKASSGPFKPETFSSLTNQLNDFGFGGASGGGAGGLASSPNVPKPGTSINPATGKPHTAGLTRAELDTMRSTGHGPLDSAASVVEGRRLSELSGREQAARQLTGGLDGDITPGKELPGGWGPTKQSGFPGSGPNAPTSVYQDITQGLEKVGKGAYGLIPQGLKDVLNPDAPVDKGKQPMGSPPKNRRSSVGVFLENAKQQAEHLIHEVQESLKDDGTRRPSTTTGFVGAPGAAADGGVFTQVKQFLAEAGQAAAHPAHVGGVVGYGTTGPAAPRTSLPSNEVAGALPGERSTGVGALPGPATEAGVAVLPDEKKSDANLPLGANQGLLPGETSAADSSASAPKSTSTNNTGSAAALGTSLGLAAALPATYLGLGAASGATDLETAGLPKSASTGTTSPVPSAAASTVDTVGTAGTVDSPTDTRHANDRTSSSASVTAIRHGHEGQRPSPLAESTIAEKPAAATTTDDDATGHETRNAALAAGATGAAVTGAAGVSGAKSQTPGNEVDGVGHPSTRGAETTREPGSYPTPEHSLEHNANGTNVHADKTKEGHGGAVAAAGAAGAVGAGALAAEHATDKHQDTQSASAKTSNVDAASTNNNSTNTEADAKPSGVPSKQFPMEGHDHATKEENEAHNHMPESEKVAPTLPPSAATGADDGSAGTKDATTPATPASPASKSALAGTGLAHDSEKGHQRTGSNASTGSNGKKKVGFMSKLKGEIKVLGGKISHDDKKVEEGLKLKQGE